MGNQSFGNTQSKLNNSAPGTMFMGLPAGSFNQGLLGQFTTPAWQSFQQQLAAPTQAAAPRVPPAAPAVPAAAAPAGDWRTQSFYGEPVGKYRTAADARLAQKLEEQGG